MRLLLSVRCDAHQPSFVGTNTGRCTAALAGTMAAKAGPGVLCRVSIDDDAAVRFGLGAQRQHARWP